MRAAGAERGDETDPQSSARTSHALHVIGWRRRRIAQSHGQERPDVYAQLQRGRAYERVETAFLEFSLPLGALFARDLGRVFGDGETARSAVGVEPHVVVLRVRPIRLERTGLAARRR